MHEVAAMRGVVKTILAYMEAAGGTRVTSVALVLGASGHLTEEAARQHFAVFAEGTPAEGADLDFTWLPATYQCFDCLHRFESGELAATVSCPTCGGVALDIAHQDVCYALAIDIAFDEAPDEEPDPREGDERTGPKVAAGI